MPSVFNCRVGETCVQTVWVHRISKQLPKFSNYLFSARSPASELTAIILAAMLLLLWANRVLLPEDYWHRQESKVGKKSL